MIPYREVSDSGATSAGQFTGHPQMEQRKGPQGERKKEDDKENQHQHESERTRWSKSSNCPETVRTAKVQQNN
jgi:hypothetical protein